MAGYKVLMVDIDTKSDETNLDAGEFIGYAAVFNNKDSHGDVIRPGAFLKSLAGYGENGAGIPAYWSHRMDDPMMNIGHTKSAVEDDRGLRVHVKLDLENPNGKQTHKLIKEGRVKMMSFAYTVKDYAWGESDDLGEYFELKELDIHEVSVVPVGANQETELLSVKNHGGASNGEVLAEILELKKNLLELVKILSDGDQGEKSTEKPTDDETGGKTDEPAVAKDDDQPETKSGEWSNMTAAEALLAIAGIKL